MSARLRHFLLGTLRGRLILSVAAVHAVLMALFVADVTWRERGLVLERQVDQASALAEALATSAAGWIVADDVQGLQELVDAQRSHPEVTFVVITDEQGMVHASTDRTPRGQYLLDLPQAPEVRVLARTQALADVVAPAYLGGRHVGWARIGIGPGDSAEKLAGITRSGILYAVAAILVGSAFAWVMGRSITRRLYAIQETINRVRGGDGKARAALAGDDEAAMIAGEFDGMLDALEQRDLRLRESEERYRHIVETAHEGVWMLDAEDRTTFVNRKMAELLGYRVEEVVGRPVYDFTDEEGQEIARRFLARRRQGLAEQHELKLLRKDGAARWTLVESVPLFDAAGAYAGALKMVSDVTDRRHMEEQLRQSQKLEAVGRLAGGVAHDFNNVLTAILGDAEELAEGLNPADPLHTDALEIQAAARRAALLTRQLLAFGRKQPAQPRVLSVGEVVSAMERMLRRLIGEDVELTVASHARVGAIRADPGQLEQVVVNLVVNARDAMPKGGRLTIETRDAELAPEDAGRSVDAPAGPYVVLSVSDTGTGMTAEVQEHIFEPFFTTKGPGAGYGLGLATVYGIVKQCGGALRVHSQPGQGSTFEVWLPRVAEAAEPLEPAPRRPRAARARCSSSRTRRWSGAWSCGSSPAPATRCSRPATGRRRCGWRPAPRAGAWSSSWRTSSCRTSAAPSSWRACARSGPTSPCCSCPATPSAAWTCRTGSTRGPRSSRSRSRPPSSRGA